MSFFSNKIVFSISIYICLYFSLFFFMFLSLICYGIFFHSLIAVGGCVLLININVFLVEGRKRNERK